MRKHDPEQKTFFRSEERIFQVNGAWWFSIREGESGPYPSRDAARDALTQFILDLRTDIELDDVSRLDNSPDGSAGWNLSDL